MPEFDPYYKWLSIPPEQQPPHHYDLLGIQIFEHDLDVIETAADRQEAYIRGFRGGENAEHAQRLLDEISAAKVELLDLTRKTTYDQWLQAATGHQEDPSEGAPPATLPSTQPPVATAAPPITSGTPPLPEPPASPSATVSSGVASAPSTPVIRSGGRSASAASRRASSRSRKKRPFVLLGFGAVALFAFVVGAFMLPGTGTFQETDDPIETPDENDQAGSDSPADPVVTDRGLVSHWTLDEGSGATAGDSTGGNDGRIKGGKWIDGVLGKGILLDGSRNYVSFKENVDLTDREYSVALWFKSDAGGDQELFALARPGTVTHGVLFEQQADGRLRYVHRAPFSGRGGVELFSAETYNDGEWHHVVAIKGAKQIRLYVDGKEVAVAEAKASLEGPTELTLGRLSRRSRYFNGALDDVRIYDRALTAAEVAVFLSAAGR